MTTSRNSTIPPLLTPPKIQPTSSKRLYPSLPNLASLSPMNQAHPHTIMNQEATSPTLTLSQPSTLSQHQTIPIPRFNSTFKSTQAQNRTRTRRWSYPFCGDAIPIPTRRSNYTPPARIIFMSANRPVLHRPTSPCPPTRLNLLQLRYNQNLLRQSAQLILLRNEPPILPKLFQEVTAIPACALSPNTNNFRPELNPVTSV